MTASCVDPCDHYRCKLQSLNFAFGSVNGVLQGPAGKESFHGPTIAERTRVAIAEAGGKSKVEPAGVRWI